MSDLRVEPPIPRLDREAPAALKVSVGEPSNADLLRLHREGLSMAQIAARVGLTRNQVLGRVTRAKWPGYPRRPAAQEPQAPGLRRFSWEGGS